MCTEQQSLDLNKDLSDAKTYFSTAPLKIVGILLTGHLEFYTFNRKLEQFKMYIGKKAEETYGKEVNVNSETPTPH